MPRKASSPVPTTRTTRRSGGVHQFLSLDLYSKGSFEKALTCYSPDENHNGIKVEPVSPSVTSVTPVASASAAKRRSVGSSQNNGSVKRPKRSSSQSSTGSWSRATSPARAASPAPTAPPPSKKRGRPAGSKATPAKQRGKSAGPKTPKKEPKTKQQPVIKQELISDDEEEEPMIPRTPGRPRKSDSDADMMRPLTRAASRVASHAPSEFAFPLPFTLNDDDDGEQQQQQRSDAQLKTALEVITAGNNPQLSSTCRKEVVTQLDQLVRVATMMTGVCYDTVVANLKISEKSIMNGARLADPAALQAKVTAVEAEADAMRKQLAEWAEKQRDWAETEAELNRMITMGQSTATEMQQSNQQLQAKLKTVKSQLEQLQKQQQLHPADRATASGAAGPSTSRQASASSSRGGGNPFPHSQMLMPHTMPQPTFNMQHLPKGSAIGQSHMAGRANELISGLANVAGLGDSMASVAVTAATMPELDEDGNQVQRTIRTRIERIAVTDDTDLEELARLGFQVVSVEGEDDGENGEGAHIEEMEGGGGEEPAYQEEGEPLVEEAD